MKIARVTLEVYIDIDPVPGAFDSALDHATRLQTMLDRAYPHYRPFVVVQPDSERYVDHDGPVTD